jgi:hypothetical protein
MNNEQRSARYTSSKIFNLTKRDRAGQNWGAPAKTYIHEKQLEQKMGRTLDTDAYSQSMAWGILMEVIVFQLLGDEYQLCSKTTTLHPDSYLGKYWSGSPDLIVPKIKVSEIKCYQPKKFAMYNDCLLQQDVDLFKKEFPQEYWQIVSNCIIQKCSIGEAISYMPRKTELEKIRKLIEETNILEAHNLDPWMFRFITEKPIGKLAWIHDDGFYNNITKFEFTVPNEDIKLLTGLVEEAAEYLDEPSMKIK